MPLYEYQCKQCGHRFEKIQSFSAPEIKECPVCQGEVEKMISAPAFQFKGSGWYVSDYGKGGAAGSNTKPEAPNRGDGAAAKSESSGSEGKGSSDSKGGSGGEAKPAAAASSSGDAGGSSGSAAKDSSTPSSAASGTSGSK